MRIISLSPSITETLEALGLQGDLAGVTDDCPVPGVETVGRPMALSSEKIQTLKPDVIVTAFAENRPEEIRVLEHTCRVAVFKVNSMPSLVQTIKDLGELFEKQNEAKELIRKIYAEWPAPCLNPVRSMLLLWNAPFLTVNANTFSSSLIEAAGGLNVFRAEPVAEIPIELEDMSDQKPDLILLPAAPYPFEKQHVDYFKNIPVFAEKSVHLIDGLLISRFGPRTVEALKTLRKITDEIKARSSKS